MTDNEIVKALECCLQEYGNCDDCPYKEYQCVSEKDGNVFYKDILDLINRQKAEIEEKDIEIDILIKKKEALRDEIDKQDVEIMRLKHEVERLQDRKHKCIYLSDNETTEFCVDSICPEFKTKKMIKDEAIKGFAEKLKEYFPSIAKAIDHTAEELIG
jgi:SMC interacting uncharacterized protein involved in chromosome segregation